MPLPKPKCSLYVRSGSKIRVKAVGIRKASRITTARGEQEHHVRTLWDGDTSYIDIGESCTSDIVYWRLIAQHLLDCAAYHIIRVVAQPCENVGMTQQSKHAISD